MVLHRPVEPAAFVGTWEIHAERDLKLEAARATAKNRRQRTYLTDERDYFQLGDNPKFRAPKSRWQAKTAFTIGPHRVVRHAVTLVVRPCLVGKIRQIVHPIFLLHSHGIDHMGQIVLGVRQNKCRVTYFISSTGAHC